MAAILQLSDVPEGESVRLVLAVLVALVSLGFAILSWGIRFVVYKALAEITELQKAREQQRLHNEWVRGVLARGGLIPASAPPDTY